MNDYSRSFTLGQTIDGCRLLDADGLGMVLRATLFDRAVPFAEQVLENLRLVVLELKRSPFQEDALIPQDEIAFDSQDVFLDVVSGTDNNPDRALLAAVHRYCQGKTDGTPLTEPAVFRARDLNALLTMADRAITNITSALDSLLSAKPRLIRPADDSEKTSPRVQSSYRITRAGLEKVMTMLKSHTAIQNPSSN